MLSTHTINERSAVSTGPASGGSMGPDVPHVVVLFGATGDLARRKLLPGLLHLYRAGFIPGCRIVGTSMDTMNDREFRELARAACRECSGPSVPSQEWDAYAPTLSFVPQAAGPRALAAAVAAAEAELRSEQGLVPRRLLYLSVPPNAATAVLATLTDAGLVENSRIVMEKPFGTDLASARALNRRLHRTFTEEQIFRIDHFLGKEPAQNILAVRFANGLLEPIWNRTFIDHVQIDVPETLGLQMRAGFYEGVGAYRDMVVTHLFQILGFVAMEAPTALEPAAIEEEKDKVFRSMLPIQPADVVRGQYTGYRDEDGVAPDSETETFIALRCAVDNWRWAGVPFFLRTGKHLAEGQRIISLAFRQPPRNMFPTDSGVGKMGPDHLTFDLADEAKMSLSFYGKRPGPGMRMDKQSLQFSMSETGHVSEILEAYERLILDAMRGDHTLFNSARSIERLWDRSSPLLDAPPPVQPYPRGSWGPDAIHGLIAPRTWRLPFERTWRLPAPAAPAPSPGTA
jgi:glucose-6-phosphate 1-dehydrogenase